ncbi:S-methyl-5'-thioinosine phosphorylase [Chitiniphilus purpureus]|uniref:Probable 6-oxopurine nucleoside phosphorylase n=1 Tax=Chitiniphilus purpureus TaxID=2981137 RepID=A0ABY6DH70_9NEIS|nr:S-methyl-5'-thioinosine phosphorylase [Chitiniphilus sp. CD1]UXY13695.1 S-methyl-5'-thioinosine phosphorylase [Chitiniphilus sp. CD1]
MLAIIGGTGATQLGHFVPTHRRVMRTPYGDPSGALTFGRIDGQDVVFIARHGYGHTIAPHQINYRANIWALAEVQADGIVALASVGGIRADLAPGVLVVPDQIIDYTWGRAQTFFSDGDKPIVHTDFTRPYDEPLRQRLLRAALQAGEGIVDGGTYACTQGPRLETAAEIRRIAGDGGDMVGMTAMPEAILAREAGLGYATLAFVSNWAAGMGDNTERVALEAAREQTAPSLERILRILRQLVVAPAAHG